MLQKRECSPQDKWLVMSKERRPGREEFRKAGLGELREDQGVGGSVQREFDSSSVKKADDIANKLSFVCVF